MTIYTKTNTFVAATIIRSADVNANFDEISTAINTTLCGGVNAVVATKGGTAQTSYTTGDMLYASASNTLSKLAVGATATQLKVVAGVPAWVAANYVVSSSSGNTQSNTTTTYADVTNLTGTITTTGRPVRLSLQADGAAEGLVQITAAVGNGYEAFGTIAFLEGTTVISEQRIAISTTNTNTTAINQLPPSMFSHFYIPSAGTYTYKVQFKLVAGTAGGISIAKTKLVAQEV